MTANDYEFEILENLKNNPQFERGMHVRVYGYQEGRPFLGYGCVLGCYWDQFYYQHLVDIQMFNDIIRTGLLACQLERETISGILGIVGGTDAAA